MTTEPTDSFFSDPKVILSLLAIGISLISFIWTLANQWEQNRRWNSLNAAAVELKAVKFKVYRIDFKDLHNKHHTRNLVAAWDADQNYWFFGKDSKDNTTL